MRVEIEVVRETPRLVYVAEIPNGTAFTYNGYPYLKINDEIILCKSELRGLKSSDFPSPNAIALPAGTVVRIIT